MNNGSGHNKHVLYATLTALGILIILALLFILYSATFGKGTNTIKIQNQTADTQKSSATDFIDNKNNIYIAGTYEVGLDLPAGDYVVVDSTKIEITSDESGSTESILAKESSAYNYCYVTVQNGEFLTVSGGEIIPLSETTTLNQPTYKDGIYLVGRDILPGDYQLIADGHGYWERNSLPVSSKGGNNSIIANENFQESATITVNNGEYLKLSNGATLINSNNTNKKEEPTS